MKGKSLNDKKKVQSEYLNRVEKFCGLGAAEATNYGINIYLSVHDKLPDHVNAYYYRSLSKEVRKPVKYSNKAK